MVLYSTKSLCYYINTSPRHYTSLRRGYGSFVHKKTLQPSSGCWYILIMRITTFTFSVLRYSNIQSDYFNFALYTKKRKEKKPTPVNKKRSFPS